MQFSKLILSTLLLALSSMAVAAPAPEADDAETLAKRLAEFEESTVDLAARSGWTCAFGGDKACQVKCVAAGRSGGYCNSKNVCTCHQG